MLLISLVSKTVLNVRSRDTHHRSAQNSAEHEVSTPNQRKVLDSAVIIVALLTHYFPWLNASRHLLRLLHADDKIEDAKREAPSAKTLEIFLSFL